MARGRRSVAKKRNTPPAVLPGGQQQEPGREIGDSSKNTNQNRAASRGPPDALHLTETQERLELESEPVGRPVSDAQQSQRDSMHANGNNASVKLVPRAPMIFSREKDHFDLLWTASLANLLRVLQEKVFVSHLIVHAAARHVTNDQATLTETFPTPPALIVSSPWSSFLWVEVITATLPCTVSIHFLAISTLLTSHPDRNVSGSIAS